MTKELSAKDKKLKASMEKALSSPDVTWVGRGRRFFGRLPSDPRCSSCLAPFEGVGGTFVKTVLNRQRAQMNPLLCNTCEEAARKTHAAGEVVLGESTVHKAGLDTAGLEKRTLELKGKSKPMDVWVMTAGHLG